MEEPKWREREYRLRKCVEGKLAWPKKKKGCMMEKKTVV